MARRLNVPTVLAQALSSSHMALWGSAHPSELLEIANELVDLSRELGDGEIMLDALLWRISDNLDLGAAETLEADCTEYLSLLDGHHSGWHRYMAAILQCVQVTCSGDFAGADALSLRAAELGVQQREPSARSFLAVRSLFRWLDGRVARTETCQLDPPADLPTAYHALWVLAWARCGRERDARAALASARSRGFASLPLDPLRRPTLAMYSLCANELDEVECAQELYPVLLEHDGLHVVLQPGVYLGPTAYFLGVLAAKLERPRQAAQHFESAIRACQTMRSRPLLWKVQLSYAQLLLGLLRRGSEQTLDSAVAPQARVEQLLTQARSLSEELNWEPWREQTLALTGELQRLPIRLTQVAG
jgi:hypothetical protein